MEIQLWIEMEQVVAPDDLHCNHIASDLASGFHSNRKLAWSFVNTFAFVMALDRPRINLNR